MGCILTIDFHQPHPLLFSSLVLFVILLRLEQKNSLRKSFYNYAQAALIIIFCLSLMGVVCSTPCEYPCYIYNDLKTKNELAFYLFIAGQAIIKGILIFIAIELCRWIFIGKDEKIEYIKKEKSIFYFIFFLFKATILAIFLMVISFFSVVIEIPFINLFEAL